MSNLICIMPSATSDMAAMSLPLRKRISNPPICTRARSPRAFLSESMHFSPKKEPGVLEEVEAVLAGGPPACCFCDKTEEEPMAKFKPTVAVRLM